MGGPKEGGKSKDRSVADSSKSLIVLEKVTVFATSKDLVYTPKQSSYPVGKCLEREMQESCQKINSSEISSKKSRTVCRQLLSDF